MAETDKMAVQRSGRWTRGLKIAVAFYVFWLAFLLFIAILDML